MLAAILLGSSSFAEDSKRRPDLKCGLQRLYDFTIYNQYLTRLTHNLEKARSDELSAYPLYLRANKLMDTKQIRHPL